MRNKKVIVITILLVTTFVFINVALATNMEVYFSLDDDPEEVIIEQIDQAEQSLNIAMYYFTDREIAQAVARTYNRGVKVRIYLDKSQTSYKYSKSRYLVKNGIPVKISANNSIMHNKFAVIDNQTVLAGSYNWTASAGERNDENLIVIHDQEIARQYNNKFDEFWTDKVDKKLTNKLYSLAGHKNNVKDKQDYSSKELFKVVNFHWDGSPSWNEWFVLKNVSNKKINLDSWKIRDEADHWFTLHDIQLSADEKITIYNYSNKRVSLDYKRALWNNSGDTLYMYDVNGELKFKYSY